MADYYGQLSKVVQAGQASEVVEAVRRGLKSGLPPQAILDRGLLHGMAALGERFRTNEIFVPEVLIATRALKRGIDTLKPAPRASPPRARAMQRREGDLPRFASL
jgi:5-methyltetrahydrofolate--homocysteine methyltransferase